jgi:secreted trypsin-like serine protease
MRGIGQASAFGLSLILVLTGIGRAGVIRHDVADSNYTSLGNSSPYNAVGRVTFGTNADWGSGTLVAGRWFITAAHLVRSNAINNTPGNVHFTVGGNTYFGEEIYLHPGYIQATPSNGNDLAIVRLTSVVPNVDPIGFYTTMDELGQTGTYVGFGRAGNGLTGQTSYSGVKRGGTNDVDVTGDQFAVGWSSNVLLSDFDSPLANESSFGSSTPRPLEYLPAEKDSGAGLFFDVDGAPRIAGVVSFALFDSDGLNFSYGDGIASTRISGQMSWISSVVPESSTVSMMSIFFSIVLLTGLTRRFRFFMSR